MSSYVPRVKKLTLEDLIDGEGNLDTNRLIEQLNSFMTPVNDALSRGIVTGQQKTIPFATGRTLETGYPFFVSVSGVTNPRKAIVIECVNETTGKAVLSGVYANVEPTSDGRLKVTYISGLEPDTKYSFTFLVLP